MSLSYVNFNIDRGTDFSLDVTIKQNGAPLNLTGYTLTSKIKKHYGSDTSYPITVVYSGNGVVNLSVASTVTSTIPIGRYYYDVLYDTGSTTVKAIEGSVIVKGTASDN